MTDRTRNIGHPDDAAAGELPHTSDPLAPFTRPELQAAAAWLATRDGEPPAPVVALIEHLAYGLVSMTTIETAAVESHSLDPAAWWALVDDAAARAS